MAAKRLALERKTIETLRKGSTLSYPASQTKYEWDWYELRYCMIYVYFGGHFEFVNNVVAWGVRN